MSLLFLEGCGCPGENKEDKECFNGEICIVNNSVSAKTVQCTALSIDGVYSGPVFVYDSLLFYYPMNRTSSSFYEIYNLKDLTLMGRFCNKGGGPDELLAATTITHFYKEDGDLKVLLYGGNEKKIREWNVSKSLSEGKTIFDRDCTFGWDVDGHVTVYNNLFRLNKDTVFVVTPSVPITLDQELISLPVYEKRSVETNKKVQSYPIFKKYPENNNVNVNSLYNILSPERFLTSFYCIKPDLTKVVQALMFMPQINILDLESGLVKGYRTNAAVDFSIFKRNIEKVDYCYTSVAANDEFIYALYWGEKITDDEEEKNPCVVHVFNWNGNLVNKIDLGVYINQITLDETNNLLYGREYNSDYVYMFDLDEL